MNTEALINLIFIVGTLLATFILGIIKLRSLKGRLILTITILIPAIILVYGFFIPNSIFGKEAVQAFITRFGIFSAFALILLQILQVLIPPLDHNVIQFIGGFIFGPWLGFIYNYIGRILGSILAFMIAKKYGRSFMKKIVSENDVEKYDEVWNKSLLLVFLGYVLPFFPDDTLSYLAGSSKIRLRTFMIILLLGHPTGILGTSLAGSLGETIWFKEPMFWIISLSTLVIGIVIFRSKNIQRFLKLSD